jgi:flagellar motor switch protein FliG
MYTFQDLAALDAKGFRTLLKEIQPDKLVVAMKTASEEIRQKIFASMSQRAAELLRDDLENLTGVKLADVEAAQREIVDRALALAAEGQISLGGDEDLV